MTELHLVYLAIIAFLGTFVTGIVGMGGGILSLALMSLFIPVEILIPLHTLIVLSSNATRAFIMKEYMNWKIIKPLAPAIFIGVALGASVQVSIPQNLFLICLAVFLLLLVWMPKSKRFKINVPNSLWGLGHGFLSTLFGAGGFLQALFVKFSLPKFEQVATFSAVILILNTFKLSTFTLLGFDVVSYLSLLVFCIPCAYAGGVVAKKGLAYIPDDVFKCLFKVLVSLIALKMIWNGVYS